MQAARDKIREFKAKLKTAKKDKVEVKTRQKWRNVVSAQQSRLKKKQEVRFLNSVIRKKDDGIEIFMQVVAEELEQRGHQDVLAAILQRCQDNITPVDNDTVEEFKELQAILEDDMDSNDDDDEDGSGDKPKKRHRKTSKAPKQALDLPEPRKFAGGMQTDAQEFCNVISDHLISSEAVLNKF